MASLGIRGADEKNEVIFALENIHELAEVGIKEAKKRGCGRKIAYCASWAFHLSETF